MRFLKNLLKVYQSNVGNIQPYKTIPVIAAFLAISGQFAFSQQSPINQTATTCIERTDNNISGLTAESLDNGWVILRWTAPGDDGYTGQAAYYDLRYQDSALGPLDTDEEWQAAIQVINEPSPAPAGEINYKLISGLESGTGYYFCIKTFDECDNGSDFSNSPLVIIDDYSDEFIPGDANGDGDLLGSDVTYLLYYFRGINPPPDPFFAGDANGDCNLIGADVTRLVGYFRGFADPPVDGNCDGVIAMNEE